MKLKRKMKLFSSDRNAGDFINLRGHLTDTVCQTENDHLVSVVSVGGTSIESKTEDHLNTFKTNLNNMVRSINDPRFGLCFYWLRREDKVRWAPHTDNKFSQYLCEEYKKNLSNSLFLNKYYLAVIYRVFPKKMKPRVFKRNDLAVFRDMTLEAVNIFQEKVNHVLEGLVEYNPVLLGCDREQKTSEVGSFYSDLIYGEPCKVPIRNVSLGNLIFNRRLMFGREVVEIRHHARTEYASCLSLKEYQEETSPTMTIALTTLPFKFNFSQSFYVVHRSDALSEIKAQKTRMLSAGDEAISQIQALEDAMDDVASGRIVFGEHNATFVTFADNIKRLNQRTSDAKICLEMTNASVCREDIALEGQFITQIPGNTAARARTGMISSLNIASFAPMFNEPQGNQYGHHWGQALLPTVTTSGTIYWLTTHMEDVGSALILGQSGSGKTVLMCMMLAMLQRRGVRTVFFDKDKGAKLTIIALGGNYVDITYGKSTGFNPFSLPKSPASMSFLVDLIGLMAGGLDAEEKVSLSDAIKSIYAAIQKPRLSTLKTFLDDTQNGLLTRLHDWFDGERYGWVFDNHIDTFGWSDITGIDITEFLDNDDLRTPVLAYLFHRIEPLIDGNPIALFMDEFSKILDDPYFTDFADNLFKVIRKLNGIVVAATQSPSHALNSKIACSVIEQTPTKILLANEYATEEEYTRALKFTQAEWDTFRTMTKKSRLMLIKSGGEAGESVQVRMPLGNSEDVLRILSGTKANVTRLENLEKLMGRLPKDWMDTITKEAI